MTVTVIFAHFHSLRQSEDEIVDGESCEVDGGSVPVSDVTPQPHDRRQQVSGNPKCGADTEDGVMQSVQSVGRDMYVFGAVIFEEFVSNERRVVESAHGEVRHIWMSSTFKFSSLFDAFKMTCPASGGTLNSTHSLIPYLMTYFDRTRPQRAR